MMVSSNLVVVLALTALLQQSCVQALGAHINTLLPSHARTRQRAVSSCMAGLSLSLSLSANRSCSCWLLVDKALWLQTMASP
jgi:hypothetical protein